VGKVLKVEWAGYTADQTRVCCDGKQGILLQGRILTSIFSLSIASPTLP
jgi:hypothetical protein